MHKLGLLLSSRLYHCLETLVEDIMLTSYDRTSHRVMEFKSLREAKFRDCYCVIEGIMKVNIVYSTTTTKHKTYKR
jgi:hypothetical protein